MAIHNRSFGQSEQRRSLTFQHFNQGLNIGETGVLGFVPFASNLEAAQIATFNVAGSPYLALTVTRFIVGQGSTSWYLGSTFPARDFGTSGVFDSGVSLPAAGSTLLILMKNDVLGYICGGAGATVGIVGGVAGAIVLKPIQDIKTVLFTD